MGWWEKEVVWDWKDSSVCEELGRELPKLGGEGISTGPKIRKQCGGGG